MILFLLECGNISEDTGIEIIDKFNLHKSIIKAMLKMNTKWREHILASHKLDFGNADDQLAIAKNNKTDKYEYQIIIFKVLKDFFNIDDRYNSHYYHDHR